MLVALHWGVEYQQRPSPSQRELAGELLRSPDVDLVYGHHAHVVQPFEKLGAEWVAYGLGNHIAEQSVLPAQTHEGVLARFTFTVVGDGSWRVTRAEYLPTAVTRSRPYRLVDLTLMLAGDDLTGTKRRAYRDSYQRISAAVESLGAAADGLLPGS